MIMKNIQEDSNEYNSQYTACILILQMYLYKQIENKMFYQTI